MTLGIIVDDAIIGTPATVFKRGTTLNMQLSEGHLGCRYPCCRLTTLAAFTPILTFILYSAI